MPTIEINKTQANEVISRNQAAASQIVNIAHPNIISANQATFFACFDGTGNTLENVPSANFQRTNVAQLWKQYKLSDQRAGGYYAGPGTPGTITQSAWNQIAVTQQVHATALNAYNDLVACTDTWLSKNKKKIITVVISAFSRGVASAAIFSQMLHELGLIKENKVLIAPGQVSVSAGVLFDPVVTGVTESVAFAPSVANIVCLFALNEYRYMFPAADYRKEHGITTIYMQGDHCDVGGGYDNGLGAITLQAATDFIQKCGLSALADVPNNLKFACPEANKLVHTEGSLASVEGRVTNWSAYRDFEANSQDLLPSTRIVHVVI